MAPGKQRKSASKSKGGKNGAGSKSKENQPASEIQVRQFILLGLHAAGEDCAERRLLIVQLHVQ